MIISFLACNEEKNEEECYDCDVPFILESSFSLTEGRLYTKTIDLLVKNNLSVLKSGNADNTVTQSSYVGTDINALIVPLSSDVENKEVFFITYALEDDVLEDYLTITIEQINEITGRTKFFDCCDELVGEIVVQNNIIVNTNVNITKSANGFGSRWNRCVKNAIMRMSSGTTGGNIEFLACVAFGPSCAAGTAIGCAGVALRN